MRDCDEFVVRARTRRLFDFVRNAAVIGTCATFWDKS